MRWLLHVFLQGLLNPAYGNVVFSRSKLRAHHKSLVFFRSLLLPAVANLMFCMYFIIFCTSMCDSVLMCCSLSQAVPESSWYLNAILWWFLRAVYRNVVFFRSKMDLHYKSLVCCRSLLLTAVANLMFCMYFLHILHICVWFCAYAVQSVADSSWVELIFECNIMMIPESRLWECRVFSFKNGLAL